MSNGVYMETERYPMNRGEDVYEPRKHVRDFRNESSIDWQNVIDWVVAIAAGVFGAAFIATAGLGSVETILAGAVITVLCGVGGVVLSNGALDVRRKHWAITATAIAGAAIGFFAVGGVVAAGVGALALPGAVSLLIISTCK